MYMEMLVFLFNSAYKAVAIGSQICIRLSQKQERVVEACQTWVRPQGSNIDGITNMSDAA